MIPATHARKNAALPSSSNSDNLRHVRAAADAGHGDGTLFLELGLALQLHLDLSRVFARQLAGLLVDEEDTSRVAAFRHLERERWCQLHHGIISLVRLDVDGE